MNSRGIILARMRAAKKPFPNATALDSRLAVTPLAATSKEMLTARFIAEAQKLSCEIQVVKDSDSAVQAILRILAGEKRILAWNFDQIPCSGLEAALHEAQVEIAASEIADAKFGLTGADAAIATTGSLVVASGKGRERTTCLLPQTHIALIAQAQILPNMESWLSEQRQNDLAAFKQSANINIISGPSRTADIAMELILGMHGPKSLQIIIIENGGG